MTINNMCARVSKLTSMQLGILKQSSVVFQMMVQNQAVGHAATTTRVILLMRHERVSTLRIPVENPSLLMLMMESTSHSIWKASHQRFVIFT